MKASVLHAILEIRARQRPASVDREPRYTRRDTSELSRAINTLRHSRFAGHDVLASFVQPGDEAIWVHHFAYDGRHSGPIWANGVWRYFGIALVVEGEVDDSILTTYEVGSSARVCICGLLGKEKEERPVEDRRVIPDQWDEYKKTTAEQEGKNAPSKK